MMKHGATSERRIAYGFKRATAKEIDDASLKTLRDLHYLHPQAIAYLPLVAVASIVGFAGNEIVARYRIRVGREIGSAALVADGLHARTDGLTSLAKKAA